LRVRHRQAARLLVPQIDRLRPRGASWAAGVPGVREVVPRGRIVSQTEKRADCRARGRLRSCCNRQLLGSSSRDLGHLRGTPGCRRDHRCPNRHAGGSRDVVGHHRDPAAHRLLAWCLAAGRVSRHPAAVAAVRLATVQRTAASAGPERIRIVQRLALTRCELRTARPFEDAALGQPTAMPAQRAKDQPQDRRAIHEREEQDQ